MFTWLYYVFIISVYWLSLRFSGVHLFSCVLSCVWWCSMAWLFCIDFQCCQLVISCYCVCSIVVFCVYYIVFHWCSVVCNGVKYCSCVFRFVFFILDYICFHLVSLVFIGCQLCSLVVISFHWFIIGVHWLSVVFHVLFNRCLLCVIGVP